MCRREEDPPPSPASPSEFFHLQGGPPSECRDEEAREEGGWLRGPLSRAGLATTLKLSSGLDRSREPQAADGTRRGAEGASRPRRRPKLGSSLLPRIVPIRQCSPHRGPGCLGTGEDHSPALTSDLGGRALVQPATDGGGGGLQEGRRALAWGRDLQGCPGNGGCSHDRVAGSSHSAWRGFLG